MRCRLAHGLLLLLMTACGAPTAPAAMACRVEPATELPVQLDHGLVLVPGALNHRPVQLVIDTGAEGSLVTPEAVAQLGLEHDPSNRTTITGVGGKITMPNARVKSFVVGRMETRYVSMAVGPLPALGTAEQPLYGLVGADYLASFDVDLDLPHNLVTLYRLHNCGNDFHPWTHPAAPVPLRHAYRNLLSVDVLIDGQRVEALVDTGARLSSLSTAVLRRLGIDPAALTRDPPTTGHGVDRTAVPGRLHQFSEVRIGQEVFRNQPIEVAPLALPNVQMLLGVDYLRTRHIWLSYATRRMFIAPPGG